MDRGAETVIVIGRSGCGKGTQARLLLDLLTARSDAKPVVYIQTGTLFREFIAGNQGFTATEAQKLMATGARFPDFLAIWNWGRVMIDRLTGAHNEHIVIDGAPRSLLEAQMLSTAVQFYNRAPATVVYINVSNEWAAERMRGRKRADDLEESDIQARLRWFDEEVSPAVDFFRSSPEYRFIEVNGEQPVEAVHQSIKSQL